MDEIKEMLAAIMQALPGKAVKAAVRDSEAELNAEAQTAETAVPAEPEAPSEPSIEEMVNKAIRAALAEILAETAADEAPEAEEEAPEEAEETTLHSEEAPDRDFDVEINSAVDAAVRGMRVPPSMADAFKRLTPRSEEGLVELNSQIEALAPVVTKMPRGGDLPPRTDNEDVSGAPRQIVSPTLVQLRAAKKGK